MSSVPSAIGLFCFLTFNMLALLVLPALSFAVTAKTVFAFCFFILTENAPFLSALPVPSVFFPALTVMAAFASAFPLTAVLLFVTVFTFGAGGEFCQAQ